MKKAVNSIAFDIGSSSGRAYLSTYENGILRLNDLSRFSSQPMAVCESLYWDVDRLNVLMKQAIHKAAAQQHIDSVGVECCGDDYGLLTEDGVLLGLPHNYRDPRTVGTEDLVEVGMPRQKLYELSGIHFMRHNTLNQLIAEKNCGDGLLEKAHDLLFLGDLFHYYMTGERHIEYSGATISQVFNCQRRCWDEEVLKAYGLPGRIFSDVIDSGEIYGQMLKEWRADCGIDYSIPVITPPTHDSASAVVPIPMTEDGDLAYISSGTWSIIALEVDRPVINDDSLRFNISNSGTALGKLMFTKNIMGLWIIQQCKRTWNAANPELSFADIVQLSNTAEPFAAMIDPDCADFFEAGDLPSRIENYLQMTGQCVVKANDIGGIARLIFESLAMKYRYIFERMFKATGKHTDKIFIIGGGGNNDAINQFTANALAKEVIVSLPEATAVGNAMMQLYGLGVVHSIREIRELAARSFPQKHFHPKNTDVWDKQYEQFKALIVSQENKSFS